MDLNKECQKKGSNYLDSYTILYNACKKFLKEEDINEIAKTTFQDEKKLISLLKENFSDQADDIFALATNIKSERIDEIHKDSIRSKLFNDKRNLAKEIFKIQPIFYDKNLLLWKWNFKYFKWEITDETDLLNIISAENDVHNTTNSKEKSEILEGLKQIGRLNKPKDLPKKCIQFKNKIINLENDEEIDVSPEYFCKNPIPFDVGKCGDTPIIDKIFEEWVGKDKVKLLKEITAFQMLQFYPIQRLIVLLGKGCNGKSVYLSFVEKLLGKENIVGIELEDLLQRFGTSAIYGKLSCHMGELNVTQLKHTSLLKKLSGGDTINYEFKRKNPYSEVNYTKIIMATNSLPTTTDKTIGFYRRWLILKFPNQFVEKRDVLSEIPLIEYENFCYQAIGLIKDLIKRRSFFNEEDFEEKKEIFEMESNPLKQFIKDFCVVSPNEEIPTFEFYDNFLAFLDERGYRQLTKTIVSRNMKEDGFEILSKSVQANNGDFKTWKYYSGITLKEKYLDKIKDNNKVSKFGFVEENVSEDVYVEKFNKKFINNIPCCVKGCNNFECNEYKGKYYCEDHFEEVQK